MTIIFTDILREILRFRAPTLFPALPATFALLVARNNIHSRCNTAVKFEKEIIIHFNTFPSFYFARFRWYKLVNKLMLVILD